VGWRPPNLAETAIIERYRRRESSVEEALIEMYWPGSRCAGSRTSPKPWAVSPSTVSDLNKQIYGTIEAWRNRPIEGVLKRSWAGEVRNVSLLVAIGVDGETFDLAAFRSVTNRGRSHHWGRHQNGHG
jgi:putative transposase